VSIGSVVGIDVGFEDELPTSVVAFEFLVGGGGESDSFGR